MTACRRRQSFVEFIDAEARPGELPSSFHFDFARLLAEPRVLIFSRLVAAVEDEAGDMP